MFFNIEELFVDIPPREFNIESELDSLSLCISFKTMVIPLGQKCPNLLQGFLQNEEQHRLRVQERFNRIIEKYDPSYAKMFIKKIFSAWWKMLYNFQ